MLSNNQENGLEAFELCLSIWGLILGHCPEKEVSEVRRLLGASLIEQACDLRDEVSALLEIWRQVRESDLPTSGSSLSTSQTLAEPPQVRQRLIQEILFFVDYLKQKSTERRRLLVTQDKNREILHYVETEADRGGSSHSSRYGGSDVGSCVSVGSGRRSCGSRPRSALSSLDGRETPLRPLTPGSQEGSSVSVLSDKVESMNESVNAMDIDSIVCHLRQALKDECEQHQKDIDFLQSCLDGDVYQSSSSTHDESLYTEPTIRELRTFGTQLEHAVLEESRDPSPLTVPSPHRLPPLSTISPRPPSNENKLSSPHCVSQHITRASQVKRTESKRTRTLPPPNSSRGKDHTLFYTGLHTRRTTQSVCTSNECSVKKPGSKSCHCSIDHRPASLGEVLQSKDNSGSELDHRSVHSS